jgi:hypothetical protein
MYKPTYETGEAGVIGDTLIVELWYPNQRPVKYISIDLIDVRASEGIRVHYDFHRDGWAIEQPTVFEWEMDDKVMDHGYKEVGFVKSWSLRKED